MASLALSNRIVLFAVWCATMAVVVAQAQSAASAGKEGSRDSALQTVLERREKQGWEAFKNKDRNGFSAIATDDYTAVIADGNGERDLNGTLDSMKEITIESYTLSDFKLTLIGAHAALLRYRASASYTIGTQPISGKLAVSDIWVKRGSQSKSLRYQETEMN
jgi:Ni/Co efflux regulator RcnB